MPESRPKSKTANRKGKQNTQQKNAGGRASAPRKGDRTPSAEPGRKASSRQDTQDARSQRAATQRNQNDMSVHQRERGSKGPVRGRVSGESYESDSNQPRSNAGRQRDNSQPQSNRGRYGQRRTEQGQRSSRGRDQYDRESGYAHGGYGSPPNSREGLENARGEFSDSGTRRQANVNEDSELNDYTDARLGSTATRGRKTRGAQTNRGSSGSARKTTGSTGRQSKSTRKSR